MKKIYSISLIIVMVFLSTGCKDWLDIRPDSETVLEDFWTNETEVQEVLASCYTALASAGTMEEIMVWSEVRSDNVVTYDDMDKNMIRMLNFDILPTNPFCNWGDLYYTINICNTFLHYAPKVVAKDENFSELELYSLESEVLAIRALAYFYLVRTFKEVPFITTPSIEDNQEYSIAKSDENFILNALIEDLKFALRYANSNFGLNTQYNKGRVTKNMIRSLLADIYLWQEDYSNCIAYCDLVLDDEELELVESEYFNYSVFFRGNSTESIFELQYDGESLNNERVTEYLGGASNVYGEWAFPMSLVDGADRIFEIEATTGNESEFDIRKYIFLEQGFELGEDYEVLKYTTYKDVIEEGRIRYGGSRSLSNANWIFYRLPDIILMKAEALIQLNQLEDALDLINITYKRSNPELLDNELLSIDAYGSADVMNKLLLRERQREFMFEGKRWFDLMRMARRENNASNLLKYISTKFTGSSINTSKLGVMDALYLPISQSEIDNNSLLEQNPFYEIEDEGTITK